MDVGIANFLAGILIVIALCLLVLLCVLTVCFCRKSRSAWHGESTILAPKDYHSAQDNEAFDYYDDICARRIEERRLARQQSLNCDDTMAELSLNRLDRQVGDALAVEQLLRDSYVFDTKLMNRPEAQVKILAAKRDYL